MVKPERRTKGDLLAATTIAWRAGPAAAGTLPGADAEAGAFVRQAVTVSSSASAAVAADRTRRDFIIVSASDRRKSAAEVRGKNHNTAGGNGD